MEPLASSVKTTESPGGEPTPPQVSPRWLLLDAAVVFLGAFLLFLIQPTYSKYILPWFGGAPLVWATALVFFQTALLAGYAYTHWLIAKVSAGRQLALHGTLLLLSFLLLPVIPGDAWKPAGGDAPTWRILAMLVVTLGLPYILLASTSPLIQAWIARYRHQIVPYRMFSLSNFASLLGLLSYPFLIEPALGLDAQFRVWSWTYVVYAVALGGLLVLTARTVKLQPRQAIAAAHPMPANDAHGSATGTSQLLWIALAACPSILFLATTQHLTLDVAPVPFLWVIPLVIYLLTFVICFEFPELLNRRFLGFAAVASSTLVSFLVAVPFLVTDFRVELVIFCGSLFLMALFCHTELYARRPEPAHLTRFYLMTALGGAIGGSFVGLVAHHLFDGHYEIYVGLAGCALLVFHTEWDRSREANGGNYTVGFSSATPLCAAALAAALPFLAASRSELRSERNFFGSLRVVEGREHGLPAWRQLDHGSTKHGLQFLRPDKRCIATTYFSADSGAGRLLTLLAQRKPALRVGIIGLGVGTLAAFSRESDRYVFYEINPLIERIAREDFGFLSECSQNVEVRLGDARVTMESEPLNHYHALLIDAFSGDSIPTHLLTREAFHVYASHLAPGGVMAINISNRYLDLRPVVKAAAASAGFSSVFVATDSNDDHGAFEALWGILSRDPALFSEAQFRNLAARTAQPGNEVLWTDDFSNLVRVLQR